MYILNLFQPYLNSRVKFLRSHVRTDRTFPPPFWTQKESLFWELIYKPSLLLKQASGSGTSQPPFPLRRIVGNPREWFKNPIKKESNILLPRGWLQYLGNTDIITIIIVKEPLTVWYPFSRVRFSAFRSLSWPRNSQMLGVTSQLLFRYIHQ